MEISLEGAAHQINTAPAVTIMHSPSRSLGRLTVTDNDELHALEERALSISEACVWCSPHFMYRGPPIEGDT